MSIKIKIADAPVSMGTAREDLGIDGNADQVIGFPDQASGYYGLPRNGFLEFRRSSLLVGDKLLGIFFVGGGCGRFFGKDQGEDVLLQSGIYVFGDLFASFRYGNI